MTDVLDNDFIPKKVRTRLYFAGALVGVVGQAVSGVCAILTPEVLDIVNGLVGVLTSFALGVVGVVASAYRPTKTD